MGTDLKEVDLSTRGNISEIIGLAVEKEIKGYFGGLEWSKTVINNNGGVFDIKIYQTAPEEVKIDKKENPTESKKDKSR